MIQHVDGEKKGKQMIKLIATDIDGTLVADGTLDLNPAVREQVSRKYSRQYLMISVLFQKMELVFIPKIINM